LNVICSRALEPSDKRKMHTIEGARHGAGFRFAIVVSSYHDFVTSRLEKGAVDTLSGAGVSVDAITVIRVPGAFEIPIAAQHAAKSARYHAIIALGCLIKGETPHMEYIAAAVANGLTAAAAATGVPMAFGVLTTNSVEEALARAGDGANNKGREAAGAALEMASVVAQLTARV
jgi:6,7-dimethyl-8-ribityllumazine synthase